MMFEIEYRGEKRTIVTELPRFTAEDLLRELGLSPVYAFVLCDGEVVDEKTPLSVSSRIEVINAISGG